MFRRRWCFPATGRDVAAADVTVKVVLVPEQIVVDVDLSGD